MGLKIYFFHYILGQNVIQPVNFNIAITGKFISPLTETNTTNLYMLSIFHLSTSSPVSGFNPTAQMQYITLIMKADPTKTSAVLHAFIYF